MNKETVAAIRISNTEVVCIEDLLVKLAMAESVAAQVADYVTELDSTDSNLIPPDPWALVGMQMAFCEVSHALKCLCWGHDDTSNH